MQTAVEDELIRLNPCASRGAGREDADERPVATVAQSSLSPGPIGIRWRLTVLLGAFASMRPEEPAEPRISAFEPPPRGVAPSGDVAADLTPREGAYGARAREACCGTTSLRRGGQARSLSPGGAAGRRACGPARASGSGRVAVLEAASVGADIDAPVGVGSTISGRSRTRRWTGDASADPETERQRQFEDPVW
ncbi:hypothetical protein GCM10010253_25580 [Streptomyces badius]|uniref:Uncharacterized protein n=1 Tax=Streptomyces badius TaxID=1941 RepID=A0ABQ2T4R8_STRBA|nr:hypothetical protein GCM10010253_25580 [Streptomyces badius]